MKLWMITASVAAVFPLVVAPVRAGMSSSVLVAAGGAAPGITVSLYAWPPSSVLVSQRPGEVVPRRLLATTTAGPGGAYSLRVPRAALAAAAASGAYDNLEINAGAASWFFTVNEVRLGLVVRHLATSPRTTCTNWSLYRNLKDAFATVGQSYVLRRARGTTQTFKYSAGQASTLGVGLSVNTPDGGFSGDGTDTVSTFAEQDFPTFGVAKVKYRTEFQMAEYTRTCGPIAKTGRMPAAARKKFCNPVIEDCTYYEVQSVAWAGGGTWRFPKSAPPSGQCVVERHGEAFHTRYEKAVTWSAGLNVPQVGFNASAQTGYDHSAEVSFAFHGRERVQLCGSGGEPPSLAGQVVVRG
jgi:hypothetical protein